MANVINGLHLVMDGLTGDPSLFNVDTLDKLMTDLAKSLEMDIIHGPLFKEVEIDESKLTGDKFTDEGGISGFCMISTSHISIHVWPLRKFFHMDIFSCKSFNDKSAVQIVYDSLQPSHLMSQLIGRSQLDIPIVTSKDHACIMVKVP